jgi:hypothetical protein
MFKFLRILCPATTNASAHSPEGHGYGKRLGKRGFSPTWTTNLYNGSVYEAPSPVYKTTTPTSHGV